ncbi:hypothetical protein DM806_15335 [Sphingobium lactosutens]|nr:hypothetical protein [Sphingobium lactosutens]
MRAQAMLRPLTEMLLVGRRDQAIAMQPAMRPVPMAILGKIDPDSQRRVQFATGPSGIATSSCLERRDNVVPAY